MHGTAGCRAHGYRYSNFKDGLWRSGLELDRKSLGELAVHEPHSFKAVLHFVAKECDLPKLKPQEFGLLRSNVIRQRPYEFVEHEWMEEKKLSEIHRREDQRVAARRLLQNVAKLGKIPVERVDQ